MIKINATIPLKEFSGEPIVINDKKWTLGVAVSNILSVHVVGGKGSPIGKYYGLSERFHNNKEVEIDLADFKELVSALEKVATVKVIILGQVLRLLDEAKDASTKTNK